MDTSTIRIVDIQNTTLFTIPLFIFRVSPVQKMFFDYSAQQCTHKSNLQF
jgi:hypothetical protein